MPKFIKFISTRFFVHRNSPHANILALLLSLAILLHSASSEAVPQLYSSASYYVYDVQTVSVLEGSMTSLNITHSLPFNSTVASAPSGYTLLQDQFGNSFLSVFERDPPIPYSYAVNSTIDVSRSRVKYLPSSYPPPSDAQSFLTPDRLANSDSPEIRLLALTITENATTNFERAALLAIWVHKRITYDASLVGREISATDILADSRGVCTEYATLFIALARSIGMPARYVNGYAYSELFGSWLGHAWAEVYLGEWVGFDPTWMEAGDIDATHIPAVRKPTLGFSTSSVTALVYPPSAQLMFDRESGSGGLRAGNIHLTSSQIDAKTSSYSLHSSSRVLPEGGKFVTWAELSSDEYRVVPLTFLPCRGQYDLVRLDDEERFLITAPNRTHYEIWEGQSPLGLPQSFRFSCPLTMNSPYLEASSLPINISTADALEWPRMEASIENSRAGAGSMQAVRVKYNSLLSGKTITLLSPEFKLEKKMESDVLFTFPSGAAGAHSLFAFGPTGDPVKLEYAVSKESGHSIGVQGLSFAAFAGDGNSIEISARAPAFAQEKEASFDIEWLGQKHTAGPYRLLGQKNFSLPFTPYASGSGLVVVRMLSDGVELASNSLVISVGEPPTAHVSGVGEPDSRSGFSTVTFAVTYPSGLSGLTLGVGKKEVPVASSEVSLSLAPGNYNGMLSWQTENGVHSSSFNFTVEVPAPPQKPFSISAPILPQIQDFITPRTSDSKSESARYPQGQPSSTPGAPLPPILYLPLALIIIIVPIALAIRSRGKKKLQPPPIPRP